MMANGGDLKMSTFFKIILDFSRLENGIILFSILSKCRQSDLSKCRHFSFIKMSTFVLSKCRHFNKNLKNA